MPIEPAIDLPRADEDGAGENEACLEPKGGDDDPPFAGSECAVPACEEEGAETEEEDRAGGFDPAIAFARGDNAKADVDGVS